MPFIGAELVEDTLRRYNSSMPCRVQLLSLFVPISLLGMGLVACTKGDETGSRGQEGAAASPSQTSEGVKGANAAATTQPGADDATRGDAKAEDDDEADSPTSDLDSLPGGASDESDEASDDDLVLLTPGGDAESLDNHDGGTNSADGSQNPAVDDSAEDEAIPGSGETDSEDTDTAGADDGGADTDEPDSSIDASVLDESLDIYLVDVEGGHATVVRFPTGQTLLVDSGVGGDRDPPRILDVLTNVIGTSRLDYLLTTHYDADHVGGALDVAAGIPVGQFLDHGDDSAPSSYLDLANAGDRVVIEAGDALDVGVAHLDFVSSAREVITEPLPGAGAVNPHCEGAEDQPGDDENAASVGFILRFGSFDFLNLADLLWNLEHQLVCPTNLLGTVDLYLTTHHGLERSGAPQLVHAIEPLAAVMNNGPRKGGGGQTWQTLSTVPGAADVWQLHQALAAPESENPAPEQIANLGSGGQDAAHWLRVSVDASGAFRIFNPRSDFAKDYQSR